MDETMSRIDGYLRALEADNLDGYYERKDRPHRKLLKTNKGRWMDKGQGKSIDRGKNRKV